jgi:hypothetical protein
METTLESIIKLLALIVPICGGLLWIIKQNRRIEKGLNKIDKHKVSYKVCDQRRAECCYNNQRKGKRR